MNGHLADQGGVPEMIGKTYLEKGKPVVVLVRWNGKGPRNDLCPPSREKSLAFTHHEEANMMANASIARNE